MDKNYCVYEHIFPNGKKYIGISCDAEKQWRNGKGVGTAVAYCWFIWEKGYKGDTVVKWFN